MSLSDEFMESKNINHTEPSEPTQPVYFDKKGKNKK